MSDANGDHTEDLLRGDSENGEDAGDEGNTLLSEELGDDDAQDNVTNEESVLLNDTADFDETNDEADLEAIKLRMKEMEEEAQKLREFNAKADDSLNMSGSSLPDGSSPIFLSPEEKKEIDGRSVYVGNVDYGATAEELESHFHGCGSINRVTINCDKYTGHPKGFAYIEFTDSDSIETAKALDESLFRGRQIKVVAKRTNIPGHSTTNRPPRGRGRFRARGFRGSYRSRPYRGAYRGRGRFSSFYSPY